jgi:hypothetical protein
MIRLFANAHYDFISKRRWLWAHRCPVDPGLALLLVRGVNYSIEFTGGRRSRSEPPRRWASRSFARRCAPVASPAPR